MPDMLTGTVTFLVSEIEGSPQGDAQHDVPHAAHATVRQAVESYGGSIFNTQDTRLWAAFTTAPDALAAALNAQHMLQSEAARVRIALHTGVVTEHDTDYVGLPLNRVSRLLAAAHGGQTLLSLATAELVRDELPPGVELRDLGTHRLKDLTRPEHIFQVVAPNLPADFPSLKSLDSYAHNLPFQPTSLIGREREVAAVIQRLQRPDIHLVTLSGPGGMGKTRLAVQVGAELLGSFADGVFFVALAPIRDPALVLSTITQVLGIKESADEPLIERLIAYLRNKRMLLVIDNFEQVLPAAPLLTSMLEAAPDLKLLVTSRALLGVYGEHTFVVPPLMLPETAHPLPLETVTHYEAVRLFIERAQAVQADFTVTNENAPAIAEICYRLDGLPLAIELAAARVRLLSPHALLARLSHRLKVLTGGARTLPARQQTLRNTLDWSYDLLDEGERALFARLAIFVGGCTLAMAELICNAANDLPIDVFDGLQSLLDKSLLYQSTGLDGEPRFLMLETIGEYAQERLAERGEAEALRRTHAEHYLALVKLAEPHFFGGQQHVWFDRMEAELDNIRAVLAWSEASEDGIEFGLQIAGMLWRFWAARGHVSEGRTWLDVLLPHRHAVPKSAVWFALHTAGNLADDQGDFAQAKVLWEECLGICRELGNKSFTGHMLNNLGEIAIMQGRYDQAGALYEEALAMYQQANNAWAIGLANRNLGKVAHAHGEYQRARELFEESIRIMRQRGDKESLAATMQELGSVTYDMGDDHAAAQLFEQAERLFREVGSKSGIAFVLSDLGEMARHAGDFPRALALLEHSLGLQREIGNKEGVVLALYRLGLVADDQGDYAAARACYNEGIQLQQSIGSKHNMAVLLEALAALAFAEGHVPPSVVLVSAASALRHSLGTPRSPRQHARHEQLVGGMQAKLGRAAFDAMWEKGQRLSIEQAAALAQAPEQAEHVQPEPQHVRSTEPPAAPKRRDLMGLTAREIDVLRLVAQGMTDAEVGEKLVISPRTVNGHLSSIYSKLGVASRTAATRIAIEHNLI